MRPIFFPYSTVTKVKLLFNIRNVELEIYIGLPNERQSMLDNKKGFLLSFKVYSPHTYPEIFGLFTQLLLLMNSTVLVEYTTK